MVLLHPKRLTKATTATSSSDSKSNSVPGHSNNPFFKPENKEPTFDSKAAEAQRKAQRGYAASDDGWSEEDDDNDEDDEPPTRNSGPAHLANLLFGVY
ncbi:unnamed protein product [[Candida] boidinii]|nr:unnamed protein product [[Candida] boidinii]